MISLRNAHMGSFDCYQASRRLECREFKLKAAVYFRQVLSFTTLYRTAEIASPTYHHIVRLPDVSALRETIEVPYDDDYPRGEEARTGTLPFALARKATAAELEKLGTRIRSVALHRPFVLDSVRLVPLSASARERCPSSEGRTSRCYGMPCPVLALRRRSLRASPAARLAAL